MNTFKLLKSKIRKIEFKPAKDNEKSCIYITTVYPYLFIKEKGRKQ